MLKPEMEKALNAQVNEELYSAYLYLAMQGWFQDRGLPGSAHWMEVQVQEELAHAARFVHYLQERGGSLRLAALARPPAEWDSPLAAFQAALEHERHISRCIDELANLAVELKDHATLNFLQWFIAEQVEEESSVGEVVARLELLGGSGNGLFVLDRDLAARPALFALPAD